MSLFFGTMTRGSLDSYADMSIHTGHEITVIDYEGFDNSLVCKTCNQYFVNYDNKNI
jgi:hypothetical protein